MKDYSIKKIDFIKLLQPAILITIPILMIFTLLVCISEKVQRFVIPNPPLSTFDEMLEPTLLPCIANYILLYIYKYLDKNYLKPNYIGKSIFAVQLTRAYIIINTILFMYYFYMRYIFDVGMWHLFKLY